MLSGYITPPFDIYSKLDLDDIFVSDGVTRTFTLKNKLGTRCGDTAEAGSTFYYRSNGSMVVDNVYNTITLSSAPTNGVVIIVPGINRLQLFPYDQPTVPGDSTPTVKSTSFYLVDFDDINWLKHIAAPGNGGVQLSLVNHDLTFGSVVNWWQLAQSVGAGGAGTYGSPGAPLVLPAIQSLDYLQSGVSAFGTSITVADGSLFAISDVLAIDWGFSQVDVATITNIVGNVLTITALNNAHLTGANVFHIGYKCWLQSTVPDNAADNMPVSMYNVTTTLIAVSESRY